MDYIYKYINILIFLYKKKKKLGTDYVTRQSLDLV